MGIGGPTSQLLEDYYRDPGKRLYLIRGWWLGQWW